MGRVYEALDTELNVHVALKTIHPEIAHNSSIVAQFRQEVRVARRITHPNVCRIFELQHDTSGPGQMYLTMEFLDGDNLRQRLQDRGALPAREALHIARQIAEALRAAHAIGVVHRDIKPANVMLVPSSGQERVVITDFGLARFAVATDSVYTRGVSQMGGLVGTPAYMAPEQLRGGEITAATDIYAFGLVLFEMLTATQASLEALAGNESWAKRHPAIAALPARWRTALEKCLQARPQDRFGTAAELIACLDGPAPSRLVPRGLHLSPRQRWAAAAALLVVCMSFLLLSYRLYSQGAQADVAPGSTVLFSTIQNDTGDKAYDNVTSLMQNQLTQAARFNLLDADRTHSILQAMEKPADTPITGATAREIAMRAGAARVLNAAPTVCGAAISQTTSGALL